MLTLAIDTAARFCAVAIYDSANDALLASHSIDIGRGHAERLPNIVQTALDEAAKDLADMDRIAVTTGPGSFAGIRVGIAYARGLSLALSIPAVGIGSLTALATSAARRVNHPVMAAIDARQDMIYAMIVASDGTALMDAQIMTLGEATDLAGSQKLSLVGNGGALILAHAATHSVPLPQDRVMNCDDAPSIGEVARMAFMLDPEHHPAVPLYLRDAGAKPQTGYALARQAQQTYQN